MNTLAMPVDIFNGTPYFPMLNRYNCFRFNIILDVVLLTQRAAARLFKRGAGGDLGAKDDGTALAEAGLVDPAKQVRCRKRGLDLVPYQRA
jgi:hypothetical protein